MNTEHQISQLKEAFFGGIWGDLKIALWFIAGGFPIAVIGLENVLCGILPNCHVMVSLPLYYSIPSMISGAYGMFRLFLVDYGI